MSLYHYTSIENLALILKNKTIRFSRLDCVDDVEESTVYESTVPMGKYTFVSCWTDNEEESIPLWNLYTPRMKGVRIKMNSSDIFYKYKHKPGVYHTSVGNVTINAEIESYFTFEEQFNDKYCILSQGVESDDFIRKVEYSKDYKKQMNDAAFSSIEIITGPHCTKSDQPNGYNKSKQTTWKLETKMSSRIHVTNHS